MMTIQDQLEQKNQQQMAEMLAHLGAEVHLLTSLLEGGHLKPGEAYYRVKDLWRQTKQAKRELFPDMAWDEKEQEVIERTPVDPELP